MWLDQPEKSAVAEHSINTGHQINFNNVFVGQTIRIHELPHQGCCPNKTQLQKLQQGQWLHAEPGLESHNKVVQT
jgi:hypothetical protein